MDRWTKPFITARDHNVDSDQVEASQPDIIDQAEGPMDPTVDSIALGGVVESDTLQSSDDVGSWNANSVEQLKPHEPRLEGLRFTMKKPGRYTCKEVEMHFLLDSDSTHRREYGRQYSPKPALRFFQ